MTTATAITIANSITNQLKNGHDSLGTCMLFRAGIMIF
jgi:hypothetical protein